MARLGGGSRPIVGAARTLPLGSDHADHRSDPARHTAVTRCRWTLRNVPSRDAIRWREISLWGPCPVRRGRAIRDAAPADPQALEEARSDHAPDSFRLSVATGHRPSAGCLKDAPRVTSPRAVQKTVSGGQRASALAAGQRPIKQPAWLPLAVIFSEGGRQWTKVNLAGRLWTHRRRF